MTPNFFIIGAPKVGTTTLASYLKQHPDILVSTPKETCFHFHEYEKGIEYYKNKYFPGYVNQSIVCDMSILNMYYCVPVASRIFHDFPNAKLLAVLRDPIQRAFSDYRESVNKGVETLKFEETLDVEEERKLKDYRKITQCMYFSRGLYYQQLQVFLKYFPKDKLKIILYEGMYQNPKGSLKNIFDFLGVENRDDIDVSISRNVNTKMVKNIRLQGFLRGEHKLGKIVKRIVPDITRSRLSKFSKRLMEFNMEPYAHNNINPEFRKRLHLYFEESNSSLAKNFNLDLSAWGS